ncbi:MAG: hypothetical protein PVI90_19655 [Desulfobacteraceae bacterium]|jgi:hypothetical protein
METEKIKWLYIDSMGRGWHTEWRGFRDHKVTGHTAESARKHAILEYGQKSVERVEFLCSASDYVAVYYMLELLGLKHMVLTCGHGLEAVHDSLIDTPKLREKRYNRYCKAVKTLGITKHDDLPPNYSLVILAAEKTRIKTVDDLDSLKKYGQFGGKFETLKEEESKHIQKFWEERKFKFND